MNRSAVTRRSALAGGVALLAAAGARSPVAAQSYPSGPVRIVHGYDAGSNPDVVSRIIGPALSERLGQPIVVEPRPGAGGRISTTFVSQQQPDGQILGMITAGDGVLAATDTKLTYDLLRDFAFIAGVIQFPFLLLVRPDSPLKSVSDLIEEARKRPGALTYGTPGVRTTQHLSGELLKSITGVDILHVPFKGNAITELISGRIDMIIAAPSVSTPQIAGGTLRGLAVTGAKRMERHGDIAAVGETLPGFEVVSWLGLVAPARTPAPIVERLGTDVQEVLKRPEVVSRLVELGTEVGSGGGDPFRARVQADIAKWKALAERVKFEP